MRMSGFDVGEAFWQSTDSAPLPPEKAGRFCSFLRAVFIVPLGDFRTFIMSSSMILFLFSISIFDCLAQEIRISDESGLTRAVIRDRTSADVSIYLKQAHEFGDNLTLKNVDGLLAPRVPDERDNKLLLFRDVPAGSWRVSTVNTSTSNSQKVSMQMYKVVIE